jgi:hypothetical protein
MRKLVTDLEAIGRYCEGREEEYDAFRAFLKGELDWEGEELDRVVHEIARAVYAAIDCTACANCCRTMAVSMNTLDVERLAAHLGLSETELEDRYLTITPDRQRLMQSLPCSFLLGSVCSVYEERPKDCRDFPHLLKPDFRSRTLSVFVNAPDCPIVFNFLERLKRAVGFG